MGVTDALVPLAILLGGAVLLYLIEAVIDPALHRRHRRLDAEIDRQTAAARSAVGSGRG